MGRYIIHSRYNNMNEMWFLEVPYRRVWDQIPTICQIKFPVKENIVRNSSQNLLENLSFYLVFVFKTFEHFLTI